jgi:glycosyltransferase involved in cell wall biosynthesis
MKWNWLTTIASPQPWSGIDGVDPGQIWVVPYGLDEMLFEKRQKVPDGPFRICFAGRQSLRKGITYLLSALEKCSNPDWELHLFGMPLSESRTDFASYKGSAKIIQHGALSQADFAASLRNMHALVLPSAEEAFGLVVVQALQCGVPCLVSDRVGAKDLIRPGQTGEIFPFGDTEALGDLLIGWDRNRVQVEDRFPRSAAAERLVSVSRPFSGKDGSV